MPRGSRTVPVRDDSRVHKTATSCHSVQGLYRTHKPWIGNLRDKSHTPGKDKKFFGFQGCLLMSMTGIPVSMSLTSANAIEKSMKDNRPKKFVKLIMRGRRRIETVIGQLAQYFDIERSGCRNMWRMTARIARKLLAYSVGVFLNVQAGRPAIQFESLITALKMLFRVQQVVHIHNYLSSVHAA